ncbi:MAG TPA: type II toxin-antitoxin system PemK/MazF family toxin [Vicinamibacteria bacterium]
MTICRRGDVVVVNVVFTGQGGSKPRPALVVSADGFHKKLPDLVVCPISSQPRFFAKPGPGDHPLRHWRFAGLRHPRTVRISNIVAIDKKILKRVLGTAQAADLAAVEHGLRLAFAL